MLELILATAILMNTQKEPQKEPDYYTLIGWQIDLASKVCKKYGGIDTLKVGQVDSFVKCNDYDNWFRLIFRTEIKEHIKL